GHGADHRELALGEVDDSRHLVDQHEAGGDERVDRAGVDAGQHVLPELPGHARASLKRLVIPRGNRMSIAIRIAPRKNDWASPGALGRTIGTTVCSICPSATTTAAPITAPHKLRRPPITDISTKFTDSK